ncbi:small acidic protein-like [Saccoglossus kowalevskii]|uniref:Small acidic protein n=1 Tax=Saccoglossus kowalevskii TaxID=10224 RepID=A0ABM0GZA1_SACKO|nr:PREDICTED: small acidic protein-like [Saccoglossus kowalevskii]
MSSGEESRGQKRSVDGTEDVHSANSWETANLGDDQRRQKFLRLMGASKKEHHGRFKIGEQQVHHARSGDEEKKIEEELESQFQHSLDEKLAGRSRRHVGLGFKEEEAEEVVTRPERKGNGKPNPQKKDEVKDKDGGDEKEKDDRDNIKEGKKREQKKPEKLEESSECDAKNTENVGNKDSLKSKDSEMDEKVSSSTN